VCESWLFSLSVYLERTRTCVSGYCQIRGKRTVCRTAKVFVMDKAHLALAAPTTHWFTMSRAHPMNTRTHSYTQTSTDNTWSPDIRFTNKPLMLTIVVRQPNNADCFEYLLPMKVSKKRSQRKTNKCRRDTNIVYVSQYQISIDAFTIVPKDWLAIQPSCQDNFLQYVITQGGLKILRKPQQYLLFQQKRNTTSIIQVISQ